MKRDKEIFLLTVTVTCSKVITSATLSLKTGEERKLELLACVAGGNSGRVFFGGEVDILSRAKPLKEFLRETESEEISFTPSHPPCGESSSQLQRLNK